MNIIHVTTLSNNRTSGISSVVPYHIESQSKYENIFWYNLNNNYIVPKRLEHIYNDTSKYSDYKIQMLPKPFSKPDLVVFHGIYFQKYCKIADQLNEKSIPYIVVPHGSLTNAAIKKKRLKKKIGFILLFKKFLKNASAIQYLTLGEYKNSGDQWNKKYLIIPNGYNSTDVQKTTFKTNCLNGVFIGRKSIYYKGLDILIDACSLAKSYLEDNNCKIHIYGSNEKGSNNILKKRITKHKLEHVVFLHEGVFDEEKKKILINSDFFILTSRSEGHPVALIEALAYGIPALITTETNMSEEVIKYDAGWAAEVSVDSVASAIIKIMRDIEDLPKKSKNAYDLSSNYLWENIAKKSTTKKDFI